MLFAYVYCFRPFVAQSAEKIHVLLDRFESADRSFNLTINIKQTECFYQPSKLVVPPTLPSYIRINNENFIQCKNFVYLGSTSQIRLNSTKNWCIGSIEPAQALVNSKRGCGITTMHLLEWSTRHTEWLYCQPYCVDNITVQRKKKLRAFKIRHQRKTTDVSWREMTTNFDVLKTAIYDWYVHLKITEMSWAQWENGDECLSKQLLYSQLKMEHRNQGRQWQWFKDVIKRNLKLRGSAGMPGSLNHCIVPWYNWYIT